MTKFLFPKKKKNSKIKTTLESNYHSMLLRISQQLRQVDRVFDIEKSTLSLMKYEPKAAADTLKIHIKSLTERKDKFSRVYDLTSCFWVGITHIVCIHIYLKIGQTACV